MLHFILYTCRRNPRTEYMESDVICMEERTEDVPLNPEPPLIGILYNLKKGVDHSTPDAEAEYDSIDTVYAIRDALESGGFRPLLLEANETLPDRLRTSRIQMAFNIAEGFRGRGREAQIPALLNMLGIPFTGSDETALCLALDKGLCKRLVSTYRVRTPKYALIHPQVTPKLRGLSFPLILKPNAEGSSKGITDACIVETPAEFKATAAKNAALYGQDFLAEEYIAGREFTVGILGNGDSAHVFSPMEILFRQDTQRHFRVYSYTVKQDYTRYVDYRCPADLTPDKEAEMKAAARKIFLALGCRDCARVDFRMDEAGRIYFIEINPLPGLAPGYSDYPMLTEFSGMPYDELILSILRTAALRCGIAL